VSRPGVPVGTLRQRLPALKARMRLPLRRGDAGPANPLTSIFLVDAPTTDASSTEIRRRLIAALPLHGLVPGTVEQHIQQHGLYVQQPLKTLEADHLHGKN
jgi:nicotinic acid mononucleotide adenylyltransferase